LEHLTTADGSVLAYETVGTGRPLVFLHGWGVDFRLWSHPIEAIDGPWKSRYRRIYVDLPGMGRSIGSKTLTNSDHVLGVIEEFLARVIGDDRYLLAGESYGGYLARGLAVRQGSRIDGLFLLCPLFLPGWRKGKVAPRVVLERDEAFLATLTEAQRREFQFLSVVQTEPLWRSYVHDIHLERLAENQGFLETQLSGGFSPDLEAAPLIFDRPVLVLLARQDSEVGFEQQYELYKDFSRASILVLDKAGHNLQIERPGLFASAFVDFLERVETWEGEVSDA
jgi:pimeloyl-ACP methyl ester carboxylesterase